MEFRSHVESKKKNVYIYINKKSDHATAANYINNSGTI